MKQRILTVAAVSFVFLSLPVRADSGPEGSLGAFAGGGNVQYNQHYYGGLYPGYSYPGGYYYHGYPSVGAGVAVGAGIAILGAMINEASPGYYYGDPYSYDNRSSAHYNGAPYPTYDTRYPDWCSPEYSGDPGCYGGTAVEPEYAR